jgi:adenylosuccinate synthase
MSLWVVVGGQFGSEGKGKIAAHIALSENIDLCVRCGGPNSGHSLQSDEGTVVLRQLPTGYLNPNTRLLIPAGALIDLEVLKHEIDAFKIDPSRIGVDRNAMIIVQEDRDTEQRMGLRERVSSTLSGVGAALSRRVLRQKDVLLARDVAPNHSPWLKGMITNVSAEVNDALAIGRKALIEGTQGFGLSLYHSEFYPKCTSRDTTAAGFLSEVGVSPLLVSEIVVVFRTFPIRVHGEQAGPLKGEISWETLQRESGYPSHISEYTSVSKMLRRVARFDWELAEAASAANKPTRIALTGLDYLHYECFGRTRFNELTPPVKDFILGVERRLGSPVRYASASPTLGAAFAIDTEADFHNATVPSRINAHLLRS